MINYSHEQGYIALGLIANFVTMSIIILHPKTEEEAHLFEDLAKVLNTPYQINDDEPVSIQKKPSDYFGTISKGEGEKMKQYIIQSRNEWEKGI